MAPQLPCLQRSSFSAAKTAWPLHKLMTVKGQHTAQQLLCLQCKRRGGVECCQGWPGDLKHRGACEDSVICFPAHGSTLLPTCRACNDHQAQCSDDGLIILQAHGSKGQHTAQQLPCLQQSLSSVLQGKPCHLQKPMALKTTQSVQMSMPADNQSSGQQLCSFSEQSALAGKASWVLRFITLHGNTLL